MRRSPQRAPWKLIYARPLSTWWNDLRSNVNIEPMDKPLPPVMSVTDTIMAVKGVTQIARLVYILPLVLLTWFVFYISVDILYPVNIQNIEKSTNRFIEMSKKKYGNDYFEITKDEVVLEIYQEVGEDGKMSFHEYLDYRKNQEGGYQSLIIKLICSIVALLLALYATYYVVFLPRLADFYFDRERKIVYTWHQNRVIACRFENLGIMENKFGLSMFMYGEFPKRGTYQHVHRFMQPTEKGYFVTEDDNSYFLATALKFMEEGKNAIIKGDEFHRSQYFFLREDPKPEDFEQRLEEVLKREHALVDIYVKNVSRQANEDKKFF
ncbi:hypothetical protein [Vibrio scophthalmi]|uniref:Uncharacterized protein n=1 Tax=Vibrio scophthalmi LMG 19158 TaxID=870967 RepID=F9RPR1_9VIBR|nr:hypothetical protein [Vibrio scophthalmi]EGU35535.1 hypothetical protein VIS19158_20017 [Vibrio scophthalmi LMG 19158]